MLRRVYFSSFTFSEELDMRVNYMTNVTYIDALIYQKINLSKPRLPDKVISDALNQAM